MLLDAADDEVNERDEGERGRGRDRAGTRLATRDDAHDVVCEHHEEQRRDEREVLAPGISQQALAHIVADELNEVLHRIDEAPLGHEARGLLSLEDKEQHKHQDHGDGEPERILGEANRVEVAGYRRRLEARNQLVDLATKAIEWIHLRPFLSSQALEPHKRPSRPL